MTSPGKPSLTSSLAWGALSGLVGTAAMTAFQKFVEMPITGRDDSYAPADFAEKVFPVSPKDQGERKRLNYLAHFGIGTGWGVGYAVASRSGLSGQRAVAAVFAAVYSGDVLLNTALGLYKPWEWSLEDTAIDVIDKLVQAEAAGAAFEALAPR
jgi:hypothetical protein